MVTPVRCTCTCPAQKGKYPGERLLSVDFKGGIQNNRVAMRLELAVAIYFLASLNQALHKGSRPGIFVQKFMEDRIDVKTIPPDVGKRLQGKVCSVHFSLRGFEKQPPFSTG